MTMNDTWGFSSHDHNWKSSTTLIRNLVDCASKGGNYLLNVGPTSLGEIPDASIERLSEVGDWMHKYSESVYGTTASPFSKALPWGRVTQKPGKIYLNVFDHTQKMIDLPGLHVKIRSLKVLGQAMTAPIPFTQDDLGVHIQLPALPDEASTVLVANVEGKIVVNEIPLQQSKDGSVDLQAIDAKVAGSTAQYESDKGAIGYWTSPTDCINWTFNLKKAGDFHVQIELACEPGAQGSTYLVQADGNWVNAKVPDTGGWTKFVKLDLGVLTIAHPGLTTVTVKPMTMPGFAVMNLKSIRLKPR